MTFVFHTSPERARIEAAGRQYQADKEQAERDKAQAWADRTREQMERRRAWASGEVEQTKFEWPTMQTINADVCRRYNLLPTIIQTSARSRLVSAARREVFWRCRHELGRSYNAIARYFDHNHTSVMYACKRYAEAQS